MDKIRLEKKDEPYLSTLYGRALDANAPDSILHDRYAADAVARIDFDFRELKLPNGGEITLPLRALQFDDWTRQFLAAHPISTVLHLGCGLDTRVYRVDPGPQVRWYDVDLPDVIALREKLYPPRPGYQMIRSSVTDLKWLDGIPGDTPVMVVAEGLTMYLQPSEGIALFRRITEQFPSGQLAFDAYSGAMVRLLSRFARVRGARIELVWGFDDPHELEREIPRLYLVENVEFLTMPELVRRLSTNAASVAMYNVMKHLAFYRHLVRHLRYEF